MLLESTNLTIQLGDLPVNLASRKINGHRSTILTTSTRVHNRVQNYHQRFIIGERVTVAYDFADVFPDGMLCRLFLLQTAQDSLEPFLEHIYIT
ncbi:hypothetical protein PsorP6_009782 [Peronosclerospora sorghi]|uniref:Uncharacterized protein n=1 Tax=Peronosclerospora sorghi TaxID=230839 RepID=A0ACC0VZW6_9STRA|nr:hypothetical protein PsorP6_009782 [Peronosclerospora sorghi]